MNELEVFTAALELTDSAARSRFLDEACGGHPELRLRIDALLRNASDASSYLESPLHGMQATIDRQPLEGPGTQIGPYKLLQQIGEGGFGVVFMAEQHEPVKRRVALKIIKPGMDTRQVIARFEAERQALAMMDHVNIARVLDAGTTEAGRPYFVMELVNGVPITKYSDDNRLTPRQRLELFVPVCQAIQHAHQKGIIHRDIKPSNVMVTLYDGQPVPKVIDFGVAKATEQKLTERTLFTQYGAMVGTLEYMSPEQAEMSALGVDTRSDIYSLGVLLYEMLTGNTPLSHKTMKEAAYAEILRMIKEEEPPKPSTRLSESGEALASISAQRHMEPAKLSKLMRGELDWIVMKTLEKDRNRRYETAKDFAADVERYLADDPVQACPPSAGYRLRKFARRNKGRLAAGAVLAAAILVAVGGIGWAVRDRGAREAEAARQQAERQAKVAGQVELILADVDHLMREQKWDEALAVAKRAGAAAVGGEADAVTAERVREWLKDLEFIDRLEQIRLEPAGDVKEADAATADRLEPIRLEPAEDAKPDGRYARAFRDYGVDVDELAASASIQRLKARPALAIPLAAALDEWAVDRRGVSEKDAAGWKRLVAIARGIDPEPLRDWLRSTWGQPASQTQDELRRLAESIDVRAHHPATLISLARTLRQAELPDAALRVLREAQAAYPGDYYLNVELGNALYYPNEDHAGASRFYTAAVCLRPNSQGDLSRLASTLRAQGKWDEVVTVYRKAIELAPKDAYAYTNLGFVLYQQKQFDEAIACYRTATELAPQDAAYHLYLGNVLHEQKKLDEAIAAYRKTIELDSNYNAAQAYVGLGRILSEQKKPDEALAAFRKAIASDPNSAYAYNNLGIALNAQGKLDEAIDAYRKAIEISPEYHAAYNNLSITLSAQGRPDEAVDVLRKAIEADPKSANAYWNLGNALQAQKRLDEAITAYRTSIELDPKFGAHGNLAIALRAQGKLDEAIAVYRQAIDARPEDASAYLCRIGQILQDQKKPADAIAAFRQAIELAPTPKLAALAYFSLGIELGRQDNLPEAIIAYRMAIQLDPEYHAAGAAINLGQILSQQNKLDEALDAFRKAIEVDQDYATESAYVNLGKVLRKRGRVGETDSVFREIELATREAFRQKPDDAQSRKALAQCLNGWAWALAAILDPEERNPGRAVSLAQEAAELAPTEGVIWRTLGVAHYRTGNWTAAREALEKSRELGFQRSSNSFFLAMTHWQLGEHDKAREWYDRAVEWMDKNMPTNEELRRFRSEADELMKNSDSLTPDP